MVNQYLQLNTVSALFQLSLHSTGVKINSQNRVQVRNRAKSGRDYTGFFAACCAMMTI